MRVVREMSFAHILGLSPLLVINVFLLIAPSLTFSFPFFLSFYFRNFSIRVMLQLVNIPMAQYKMSINGVKRADQT
jgi:hypothetical protein